MDGDGQLLAARVGRADLGTRADVAKAQRIGAAPEIERAAVEDAVDGSDKGAPVGAHRRQRQQAHALQDLHEAQRVQAAIGGVDREQVGPGAGIARVDQPLQPGDVRVGLVHS